MEAYTRMVVTLCVLGGFVGIVASGVAKIFMLVTGGGGNLF